MTVAESDNSRIGVTWYTNIDRDIDAEIHEIDVISTSVLQVFFCLNVISVQKLPG